jgi:glycosyltransferase involved in cell wall biosynthesis
MVGPSLSGVEAGNSILDPRGRRRPVLMIVHAYYDEDPRVRREAESLAAAGRPVTVVGLRRPGEAADGTLNGVRIRRLDVQRHQGASLWTYLREYLAFLLRATVEGVRNERRERLALAHVHSLPDFLVFAALPLRLAGVPVILDLHEAMPEFFRSRFPGAANPLTLGLLHLQERLSIAFSSATITVNEAMAARLIGHGVPPGKVSVIINSPSLARFDATAFPTRSFRQDGTLRLIYTGALTPTYELDVAIDAVAAIAAARPELDVRFDLYGRGDTEAALRARAARQGIAGRIAFHGRIPIDDVPAAVAAADIGLAPTRLDPFTAVTLSTKVYEYGAMGKPVVASRLPLVERNFPPGTVVTYEPGDTGALVAAILGCVDDAAARLAAVGRTGEIVRAAAWERESGRFVALIDRLAGDRED